MVGRDAVEPRIFSLDLAARRAAATEGGFESAAPWFGDEEKT
jgi:hypothetical protein